MGAAGGGATPTPSLTTCGSGAGRRRRPAARRLRRPATPQTATEEGQRHFRHLQEDPDVSQSFAFPLILHDVPIETFLVSISDQHFLLRVIASIDLWFLSFCS